MVAPIQILLQTHSAMQRELWRTVLSTPTQVCAAEFADLPPQTPVDVVIVDHQVEDDWQAQFAAGDANGGDVRPTFDGGVIKVGGAGSEAVSGVEPENPTVDQDGVWLPANATARELKLAVLLVAQLVRLRREHIAQNVLNDGYEELAFQDPLTSVANRRAWDRELALRWDDHFSREGPLCLALFDVDQLKQINDTLGHAEGDDVLRAMAEALVASVRDEDFVARLGGDEFGVLLADIDPASAHRIVDRIRCSTSRYLATGEPSADSLPVTASAGYACPLPDDDVETLSRRADQALRASKQAGRNMTSGPREPS